MKFGHWHLLHEAPGHAPGEPGVFQVRIARGLIDYPTGKSAMIHYAGAEDLAGAIAAFAADHAGRSWLVRWTIELSAAERRDPRHACARLAGDFRRRFGIEPALPT